MIKRSVLFLVALALAALPASAQQKQIKLGGGFVLNTKIQQPVNFTSLNKMFPIKYEAPVQYAFRRAAAPADAQQQLKDPVRTICGETVEKASAVKVIEQRDWYVQKGSACADEYIRQWLSQQESEVRAFTEAAAKRLQCEKNLPPLKNVETHRCAICGTVIDLRCGAISTWEENGETKYANADCFAKRRHETKEAALRTLLGVTAEDSARFAKQEADRLAAQQKMIADLKAFSSGAKKAVEAAPAAVHAAPVEVSAQVKGNAVTFAEASRYSERHAQTLKRIAQKKRAGQALTEKEERVFNRFNAMQQSLRTGEPMAAEAVAVKVPAKKQPKKAKVKKSEPAQEQASRPVQKKRQITQADVKKFERANAGDMEMIRALAVSGAATSDTMLSSKVTVYKQLLEAAQN